MSKIVSPSENLSGREVVGSKTGGTWRIGKKIEKDPRGSGGTFSVGYEATHEDGTEVFVKATDIGLLNKGSNASALQQMTNAFNEQVFERTILDICQGNNMDRVVHALDYGEYETEETGVRDYVFFIIFEKAQGDVRSRYIVQRKTEFSWILNSLHNLSVAVQQLHSENIAHNDIKPSNLLIFGEQLQKLADLGRATSERVAGPWDSLPYCGDSSYAAPEFWYHTATIPQIGGRVVFDSRRASDLYLLGSMGFFFVSGEALSPMIQVCLRPEHWPTNWTGNYQDVLPYLRDGLGKAMERFDAQLPTDENGELIREASELRAAITQLCEPDPALRGHPLNLRSGLSLYGVERFVSTFDRLSKGYSIRARK